MRSLLTLLACSVLSLNGFAQPKGFSPVKNTAAFQQALSASNAKLTTIASDFTQVKNLNLLAEKIKSRGKFYFKKEDKIRIEYIQPYSYVMVMNAGQMMVKDDKKISKINTKNSKTMQSVNKIMIDCMKGTVFQNTDFKVVAYESGNEYLLSLTPVTPDMKKMFSQIDVFMDKKELDVNMLKMTEQGGDNTEMNFTNTQRNTAVNDALFKIK